MTHLEIGLTALGLVFAFFLLLPVVNVGVSLLARERLPNRPRVKLYDFGCVVTAWRNAELAKGLVRSILEQPYKNYLVYVVLDDCEAEAWDLEHERLVVLRPEPPLNLKVKSIIYAVERFRRPHDFVVVFDADNLVHPQFFSEVNRYANAGFKAIQGRRTAKNLDTLYARLDALGEFYKNYVERYVPYLLGSSAVISGSGMAVHTPLYCAYLISPEVQRGKEKGRAILQEDKILQNFILRQGYRIAYAWKALVYDEKVRDARAATTQRSRWLYSYFQNIPNALEHLLRGVVGLNWNRWLFGWVTLAPPLLIQVLGAVVVGALAWETLPRLSFVLGAALGLFALNVLLVLQLSKAPAAVRNAVWLTPVFLFRQFLALFKMGNPQKNFQPTPHDRKLDVDEVLKD